MGFLSLLMVSRLVVTVAGGEGFSPPPWVKVQARSGSGEVVTVEKVTKFGKELTLHPGSWEITCSGPGFWPFRKALMVAEGVQQVTCTMLPEVQVQGQLVFPSRGNLPPLTLHLIDEQGSSTTEPLPCAQQEDRFRCRAPAGLRSLRLRVAGYASVFFWDQRLTPASPKDLGKIQLRPGASLTGWVTEGRAKVRARGEPLGDVPPRLKEQLATEANDRGFFHLPGLPGGRYRVWAEKGALRSQPVMVTVEEGGETQLVDALALAEPVNATVQLSPPRDKSEKPWRLEVWDRDPARATMEKVLETAADSTGHANIPGILPGEYFVRVMDSQGKDVYAGLQRLDTGLVFLSLEGVQVRGVVRLGDEPLVAQLYFGGEFARNAKVCATEKEGKFACTLPEAGTWPLTVKGEGVVRNLLVEVKPPKGKKEVFLELSFPATELRGEVVTAQGEVPKKCIVNVERAGEPLVTQLFLQGQKEFVFKGLEPGLWSLRAEAPDAVSKTVLVTLDPERQTPKVTLVLESRREVRGRVVVGGSSTGVVGAEVKAFSFPKLGGMPLSAASTDEEGFFSLNLPQELSTVVLLVEAPGFARRCLPLRLEHQELLVVSVDEQGGTVLLRFPKALSNKVSLVHECMTEGVGDLQSWAMANGGREDSQGQEITMEIPRLSPGRYGLCPQAQGTAGSSHGCVWGQLAVGGTLELVLGES
ncbi:MAG: hypothetical protein ACUVRQ_09630 [Thermoanaerobaculaceae bacterium]